MPSYLSSSLFNYAVLTVLFLFILPFIITHTGDAINIDEYAPAVIPTNNGNENSLTVGTNTFTATININVVNEVLIDLAKVLLIIVFAI